MKKYHNSKLQTIGKSVLESPGQNVLMPLGRIIRSIIHTISACQLINWDNLHINQVVA